METGNSVDALVECSLASATGSGLSTSRPLLSDWERMSRWLVWTSAGLLVLVAGRNLWNTRLYLERIQAIRCDEPIHQFRDGFIGDHVDHTFYLTNVGRVPLTVGSIETSCGCAAVDKTLKGRTIQPRESLAVPVTLRLDGAGDVARDVRVVFSGDPVLKVTLKLKGTVSARWTWSPSRVVFDGVAPAAKTVKMVTLVHNRKAPAARIEYLTTSSGAWFQANLIPREDGSDNAECPIQITADVGAHTGRQDAAVFAKVSDSPGLIGPIPVILVVSKSSK